MTRDEKVRQKLSAWRPGPGRQQLTIADDGFRLHLTADKQDELGCMVWELAVRRTPAPGDTLRAWAERIAQRTTGLLEQLAVVEIDHERNEGLLRSDQPSERGGQQFYCELLLQGTAEAVLRRYRAASDSARRRQVAFALTHDALAKLAGDLAN